MFEKLVIHFDVNKTIIFVDPAGGKSVEDLVNGALAQYSYGKILNDAVPNPLEDEDPGLFQWELVTTTPSLLSPDPSLITYSDFLEFFLYPDMKFDSDVTSTEKYRLNGEQKKKRDYGKKTFTEVGFVGESMRSHYNSFLKKLESSRPTKESKYVFLLPCFFQCLIDLVNRGVDFQYVIRTFGSDIEDIEKEINLFCDGKHHDYPEALYNGEKGTFYRNGNTAEDVYYIPGTIDQITTVEKISFEDIQKHYPGREIVRGVKNIYEMISHTKKPMAIRDFYPWWQTNSRIPSSGKPFFIDLQDSSILQIFFDDNVWMGNEKLGIVDIRTIDGKPLNHVDYLNQYLVNVEPLESVFDVNYFSKRIDLCTSNAYGKK